MDNIGEGLAPIGENTPIGEDEQLPSVSEKPKKTTEEKGNTVSRTA